LCSAKKKQQLTWLLLHLFHRVTDLLFYFYGGEVLSLWCSQFWELLETFVGIFFFFVLSKEKKSAHEKRKKKKPMI
jgi:hypothetical protein